MAYDTHSLFAYSLIATVISQTGSTAIITVQTGDGAKFALAQQVTFCPANTQPFFSNAMIGRITAISGDQLTIDVSTANREGSSTATLSPGYQIANSITPKALIDIERSLPQFNVMWYGAKGDGTTDDSTAIQAAITACTTAGGGTVFFPAGTFLVNTALAMKSNVALVGAGYASILKCNGSNDLLHLYGIQYFAVQNMNLQATGGHVFDISSLGIANGWIANNLITQNSTNKAIWNQPNSGNCVEVHFIDNTMTAAGATRSIPAIYMIATTDSNFNDSWWTNNNFNYQGCNNQYFIYMEAQNSNFSYNNHFLDNVFEICNGGCIQLLSAANTIIEGCWSWDGTAIAAPVIYLGASPTAGLSTKNTTILNSGRINGTVNAGVKDIVLESTTKITLIQNFRCNPDAGKIELNNAADVYLLGISSGTTITNATGVILLSSGGLIQATQIVRTSQALATSGTISVDPTQGEILTITPSGAATFNMATVRAAGQTLTFVVTTSGTSAWTLTFGTHMKSTGTLSTGTVSAKVFTVTFVSDGTNYNETSRTSAM